MLSFAPQSGYGMSKDMASLAAVAQANSISLQANLRSTTAGIKLAAANAKADINKQDPLASFQASYNALVARRDAMQVMFGAHGSD